MLTLCPRVEARNAPHPMIRVTTRVSPWCVRATSRFELRQIERSVTRRGLYASSTASANRSPGTRSIVEMTNVSTSRMMSDAKRSSCLFSAPYS